MSGDVDHEDKTEEPTEKRLHDAVEKGQTAFSREAPLFASLSAALVALVFVIPGRAETLLAGLVGILDDPAGWRIVRGEDALALAGPLARRGCEFLWPVVALLAPAGVVASVAQAAPRIVPDRIMPDFSRISPRAGLRRVFGAARARRVREKPDQARRSRLGRRRDADQREGRSPDRDGRRSRRPAGAHPCARGQDDRGGSGGDARRLARRPRLVAHPVAERQPHEQARGEGGAEAGRGRPHGQGPPEVAAARPVPKADAVGRAAGDHGGGQSDPLRGRDALRAQRGRRADGPRQGVDLVALKIRAIAEAHDIPVIEDRPLARSLYSAAEVERPIPGRVLSRGRRDRASDPEEESGMGPTKCVDAPRRTARPFDRERIIADALIDVASELRLTDVAELITLIRNDQDANLADLVNSSTELFFKSGTLRYALSATSARPGTRPRSWRSTWSSATRGSRPSSG